MVSEKEFNEIKMGDTITISPVDNCMPYSRIFLKDICDTLGVTEYTGEVIGTESGGHERHVFLLHNTGCNCLRTGTSSFGSGIVTWNPNVHKGIGCFGVNAKLLISLKIIGRSNSGFKIESNEDRGGLSFL